MSENLQDVKALILSGGGVKGTFQYGALDHIYNHVLDEGERFKIVCGVSAGAMNGSIVVQDKFQEGKEIWMDQIQNGVPAFDFRYSPSTMLLYSILPGFVLLNKLKKTDSIFVNHRLREILIETCSDLVEILEENDDYLRLGIVDYQTPEYISIDPTKPEYRDRVIDVIIASTTIPLAFPPVEMDNRQYFDGGAINVTPFADIFEILRKPSDFSTKYNLTTIFSVLCSPLELGESQHEYKGLIDISVRTIDILMKEIYQNDKSSFNKTNVLAYLWKEIKKAVTSDELKRIREDIKEYYEVNNIDQYVVVPENRVVAPDPKEWINFIQSDLYPEGVEMPELEEDSEKMFWDFWPSTLNRDPEKLLLCYHFGMYMARKEALERLKKN